MINFIRIDDRVIHGQLVTRWSKIQKCDGIIAVDDETANNPTVCDVLKSAVPESIKVRIYTVEKAAELLGKVESSARSYFLITKSPITLVRLVEKNVDLGKVKVINVGPKGLAANTTTIAPNVSITPEEFEAFNTLEKNGYQISIQLVPDHKAQNWADSVTQYNKNISK